MSQYKTRRQQKQARQRNTVIVLLLIIVAAGLTAGVVFLKKHQTQQDISKAAPAITHQDSIKTTPSVNIPKTSEPKPVTIVDSVVKTPQLPAQDTVTKKPEIIAKPSLVHAVTDSQSKQIATTSNLKKETELKQWTDQQMQEILAGVMQQKNQLSSFSNCIQVRKTENCNIDNVFAIADYLKSKGFVISGRLTVPQNQKGFQIEAAGTCLTLTVGAF